MCKRLSDETREAVLSGLETLGNGAEEIKIWTETDRIYLTKLGPKRYQVTITAKESCALGDEKEKGPGKQKFGRRMSGLRDRRAAITGRRVNLGGRMADRVKGDMDFLGRSRVARRAGPADR